MAHEAEGRRRGEAGCWFRYYAIYVFASRRRHARCYRDWSSDVCSSDPSRRRHTRCYRDWSSDMCSSDLKGMTDEMLEWQTRRFLELETSRSEYVVHVRPEQVVEVAFDGIQTSTRYP